MFSKFRNSKKGNNSQGAVEVKETKRQPYRHVPTHAARDSLVCTPVHWQTSQRRKRHSDVPISRTESSLSAIVNGGSTYLPRASSYAGPSMTSNATSMYSRPSWDGRGDTPSVTSVEHNYARHKFPRGYSYHGTASHDYAIGPSPLSSNMASTEVSISPGHSSESDSDNLQIVNTSLKRSIDSSRKRVKGKDKVENELGRESFSNDKTPTVTVSIVAEEKVEKKRRSKWMRDSKLVSKLTA